MGSFDRLLMFLKSPWAARLATMGVPLLFLAFVLVDRLPDTLDAYRTESPGGDFDYFYNSGLIITGDDPSVLYEGGVSREAWESEHGFRYPGAYPYPPTTAVLMSPLTQTSRSAAFDVWKVATGLSAGTLALIVASAFKSWPWRIAVVAAVIGWQPLLLNLIIGQTGAFIALLTALGFLLFLRNRNLGAIALSLLSLKPTAAMPAMLAVFPQRFEVWVRFIIPAALIGVVPFLWLGLGALRGWVDILSRRGSQDLDASHPYNHGLTGLLQANEVVMYGILVLVLLAVLFAAQRVYDRLGLEASCGFAVVTGLLLNPHSMLYDWAVAFVAIMLVRRAHNLGRLQSDLGAGLLAVTLFFAGQWSSSSVYEDTLLRPVTLWAVVVAGWIGLRSLWPAGGWAAALSRRLAPSAGATRG